ncbi:hypothetical protein HRbin18_01315 [bacterium HR18]|nr:hypothetical protein HRbin18_01315 [bacterium HR18]
MIGAIAQELLELTFGDRLFQAALIFFYVLVGLTGLMVIAAVLLRWRNEWQQAHLQHQEARWKAQLMAVLVGAQPPETLWAIVAPNEALAFCAFLYRFARRVKGTELAQFRRLARPYLPQLRRAIDRGSPEKRAYYLQILGVLSDENLSEVLLQALDDPAPLVALVAFRRLARAENAHLTPHLVDRLHRFSQSSPALLASLLSRLGFEALPMLRQALSDVQRPSWVRAVLAETLSLLNDPHGAFIAARLLQEKDLPEELTIALLRLLAHGGSPAHATILLPYLRHPKEALRLEAVQTLGTIGDSSSLPLLVEAMHDDSPWVALAAARALKRQNAFSLLAQLAEQYPSRRLLIEQVLHESPQEEP